MIQLPSVQPSNWRLRDAYLDGVTGACAFGAAALGAINVYGQKNSGWLFMGSVVFAVIALLVGFVKVRRSLAKEKRYEPLTEPKDIAGWASGCHALLFEKALDPNDSVRLTVYRVVYDRRLFEPEYLEQIISYVGGSGGRPGRELSARVGVVGVSARCGEPHFAERNFDGLEEFRADMVLAIGATPRKSLGSSLLIVGAFWLVRSLRQKTALSSL